MTNKELKEKRIKGYFIEATKELVEKHEQSRPTARDIAKLAGYSPATIYKYFGSLDNLIAVTADYYAGLIDSKISKELKGKTDIVEKIKILYEIFPDFFISRPAVFKMIFMNESLGSDYDPGLVSNFYRMEKTRHDLFIELAEKYGLSRDEGLRLENILSSNTLGSLYMWVSGRFRVPGEELKEAIKKNIDFILTIFEERKVDKK